MKNKLEILSIILFPFFCSTSCNESITKDNIPINKKEVQVLNVYENINKEKLSFSLNEIANDQQIVSFETTDSFTIQNIDLQFVTPQHICMRNQNKLIFFDHFGKYQFMRMTKEDGSKNYISIADVIYNLNDSTCYIRDMHKGKTLKYEINEPLIEDFDINGIDNTRSSNNRYAIYNIPKTNRYNNGEIQNKQYKGENDFFSSNSKSKKSLNRLDDFIHTTHGICMKPTNSDTLFQLSGNKKEPLVIVDKQKMAMPSDVKDMTEQINFQNYVTNENSLIINHLYFMSFNYQNKLYQDIWDIKQGKLLYRKIVSSIEDKYGVPIHLNDKLIHVWPILINDFVVYCKIDEGDKQLLKSNVEDSNMLLKFMAYPMDL